MCTIYLQKSKEVSAVSLRVTLHTNDYNHSYPSTQQTTNLIQYGVATGVTLTYNTTNIHNELSFHQFICQDVQVNMENDRM